jgi:hypothetical protein
MRFLPGAAAHGISWGTRWKFVWTRSTWFVDGFALSRSGSTQANVEDAVEIRGAHRVNANRASLTKKESAVALVEAVRQSRKLVGQALPIGVKAADHFLDGRPL